MRIWAGENPLSRIVRHLRRTFVAGAFAAFPIIVTYWVVRWLFGLLDDLLAPLIDPWVGFHIPGLSFVVSIVLFYLFGMLSANVIGRQLQAGLDQVLAHLPLLRTVYTSSKQLIDALSSREGKRRQRVVLVEFPAKGHYMVGFVTTDIPAGRLHAAGTAVVFVPTSPNPTSGALLFLPEEALIPTVLSAEEAFKIILSGGVVTPDALGPAAAGAH